MGSREHFFLNFAILVFFNLFSFFHYIRQQIKFTNDLAAVIAPWFCLRLPSSVPRFESRSHHLCFFQFVLLNLQREKDGNKNIKRPRLAHFYNKNSPMTGFEPRISDLGSNHLYQLSPLGWLNIGKAVQ